MMPSAATNEPYVLAMIANTAYALPSRSVERMEMVEQVTPVPNAAEFVDGVVFSRGKVVPAINLRSRFGFERVSYDISTRILVVSHGDRVVGLIVDSAREFVTIENDAIQPPPDIVGATTGRYLRGVATVDDRVILILDVAGILDSTAA